MTSEIPKETSVTPFVSAGARMLDSVIAQISKMEDLPPTRRRDLKSALNTLARIIGRRPSEIPANINWLHIRVRKIVPAQYNITKKRLANIKSDALKALELTGCSRKRSDWLAPVSQDWSDLLGLIENKHDFWKLTQLAQFCSALSVGLSRAAQIGPLGRRKSRPVGVTSDGWGQVCALGPAAPHKASGFQGALLREGQFLVSVFG